MTRLGSVMLAVLAGLTLTAPTARALPPDNARGALAALQAGADPGTVAVRRLIESGPADLARARAAAEAAGLPLDPARLQRRPVASALDAAPLYVRLEALRRRGPSLGLDLTLYPPNPRYVQTPAQVASVRHFLAHQGEALALAHRAASRPFCVFRRDWSQGQGVLLSEYAYQNDAARLLCTQAYLWARDGHRGAALGNAALVLHIADQFAADPTMYAYGGSLSVEAKGLSSLADTLEVSRGDPRVARQVLDILATRLPHPSAWYARAGELSLRLIAFDAARQEWEPHWGWDAASEWLSDTTSATADRPITSVTLDERRLLAGLWDAWEAQYLSDATRQVTRLRAGTLPQEIAPAPPAVGGWAVRILRLPDVTSGNATLAGLGTAQEAQQARENVLRTAAGLLAHPTHPPHLPPDPFSGHPLGFRREGRRGFVVYSVGEDGTFRGGRPSDPPSPYPILFRFPASKPAPPPDFYDGF